MGILGLSVRIGLPLAAAIGCALAACSGAEPVSGHLGVTTAALRPDSPNTDELPPVFGANENVELFDSAGGSFRVHYTRAGDNAVPAADADGDGVPDYVQLAAAEYDKVGDYYASELGFDRPPSDEAVPNDNGGNARFDVYLVDFSTTSDGSFRAEQCTSATATRCPGYMKQENDFAGHNYASLALATRILASHEYFHAVQAGYDAKAGANINEGTAVWASEEYDPSLEDLEGFVAGYLDRPDRGLTQEPTGPVDAFSYGSSLFFQFLGERYGRETIRQLWAALRERSVSDGPDVTWPPTLDSVLKAEHASSIADAFAEFSRWNLFTAGRADPERAYASGRSYPELVTKAVTLPFEDTAPRVFPLAAKFYSVRVRDAGSITLALRSDVSLEGLRLLLARESGGKIVEAQEASASEMPAVTLSAVESGDTVFAALLNTKLEGESLRPDVCLGGAAEIKACTGKGGAESDAGSSEADASDTTDSKSDDGRCDVSAPGVRGARRGSLPAILLLLGATLASCRRPLRRRRAGTRNPAPRSPSSET
ncbi:MAG TPA: MXAN_6640 family putative metalloprotease [Polyangiales bacterium]|nr:MXAN_6640 family putative metalloprotease [Polyangiales bacterium]